MGSKKVLVVGWYNKGNLGDEAFKSSFRLLWPKTTFDFQDHIPPDVNASYDCVFIGGGSFLDLPLPQIETVSIPMGFIGIGLGRFIEPANLAAIRRAAVVIVRDTLSAGYLPPEIGHIVAPDLVFAQPNDYPYSGSNRHVLVIGNDFLSPSYKSAEWQSLAYAWFCQEFAKIADQMVDHRVHVELIPMCINKSIDDRRFNSQIVTRMKHRGLVNWETVEVGDAKLRWLIAESELVVSLRLHGAILAAMAGTPFVLIGSHEKMDGFMETLDTGMYLDYYGFTSRGFDAAIRNPKMKAPTSYPDNARERWKCIADIVATTFYL